MPKAVGRRSSFWRDRHLADIRTNPYLIAAAEVVRQSETFHAFISTILGKDREPKEIRRFNALLAASEEISGTSEPDAAIYAPVVETRPAQLVRHFWSLAAILALALTHPLGKGGSRTGSLGGEVIVVISDNEVSPLQTGSGVAG